MKKKLRCDYYVAFALDILRDKWVLVINKQMLMQGKQTFKDFIESDEAIATNILAIKFKLLEEIGMVTKSKLPNNNKSVYYHLTDKGLSLMPIIVELAIWSDANLRGNNPIMLTGEELTLIKFNKDRIIKTLIKNYKEKLLQQFVRGNCFLPSETIHILYVYCNIKNIDH